MKEDLFSLNKIKNWFLEKSLLEAESGNEKRLIVFVFYFFLLNALIYSFFSFFSMLYGTYFELEVVLLSILFDVGLLFSLRIRGDYKFTSKVYVVYTLLTMSLLMIAMREAHLYVIVWYIIPVLFAHFVIGTRWLIGAMVYSLVLLLVVIFLRVNHLELLDHNLVGKYNLEFATPFSLIPAFGLLYFLLSNYSASEISATSIIKEQEKALFESKVLKDNIISVVAHDLKSPIASIEGLITILEFELGKGENRNQADVDLFIDKIKILCGYSNKLIFQLLDMERLKSGGVELQFQRVNLIELVNRCVLTNQANAQKKCIEIRQEQSENQSFVHVDELRIEQVINNLMSNAIKFSNANSYVSIGVEKIDSKVRLSVRDTGIGIPKIQQSIIFDKFTKAKRPGTFGEKPHGLGLSIVHQIVELHNAKIWLESEVDQGTVFYVEFEEA